MSFENPRYGLPPFVVMLRGSVLVKRVAAIVGAAFSLFYLLTCLAQAEAEMWDGSAAALALTFEVLWPFVFALAVFCVVCCVRVEQVKEDER